MESVSVSIVVPVWNTVDFLRSCVESIVNQEYQDIEIILVDDGSTDGSSTLCDTLAREDKRIKVLHQENCGAAAARKNGVALSRGEWVMFVDSDDTITPHGLAFLMKMSNGYDIIAGGININGHLFAHKKDGAYGAARYIEALLLNQTTDGPVGKIIRRALFEDLEWDTPKEIFQNEDMLMLVRLAKRSSKILLISDVICYNYLLRTGTASSARMEEGRWIELFTLIEKSIQPIVIEDSNIRRAFLVYRLRRLYYNVLKKGILVRDSNYLRTLSSQMACIETDESAERIMKTLTSVIRQSVVLLKVRASWLLHLTRRNAKSVFGQSL